MMKQTKFLLAVLLATAFTACEDPSDPFYTATYPVVRIEAEVRLDTPEGADTPDETLRAGIEAEVLAEAPVQAGGWYRVAFTRHDGGTLTVCPAPGAGTVAGTFDKEPGTQEMAFAFGEERYTVRMQTGLLTADLTEEYRTRYPDAGIAQVLRREYQTEKEPGEPENPENPENPQP